MTFQHRNKNILYIGIATVLILLIPLVLTLCGSGVDGVGFHWTFFDFVFMGALIFGTGLVYELIARKMNNVAYRSAVAVAVGTGFLIVWINAAVGIVGESDSPINMMYFGILALGLAFALIGRFRPQGMTRALYVTVITHSVLAVAIWITELGSPENSPLRILLLNSFFVALWLLSALLFRKASGKVK